MKPRLNIMGRKHKIVDMHFKAGTNDEIDHVMYETVENDGVTPIFQTLCDSSSSLKDSYDHVDNLASLIVDDTPSPFLKLIKHLEDMQKEEHFKLQDILTEMGELKEELPFDKLEDKLLSKHGEFKLMQQRVFGIIDAVEEVKAYAEGYYANVDDEALEGGEIK
ncbi:hypothetical protein [Lysinibacillus sp. RS5]|uniref:hypothetical protein n=1 Tax=unclassified Lysinibacillus TaxID=2636778 RepID=UPI0035BE1CB5